MLRAVIKSSWKSITLPILPRLLLIALRFAQPFLVNDVVSYLGTPGGSSSVGYGLIAAFALVFIGLAVRFCLR
jgi:ATP-binding cassette subfamily C (CFTR/MRP) protein 1